MSNPEVIVQIRRTRRRWPLRRPQRWYWVAVDAHNGLPLARSSETYTNRGDVVDVAARLFPGAPRSQPD